MFEPDCLQVQCRHPPPVAPCSSALCQMQSPWSCKAKMGCQSFLMVFALRTCHQTQSPHRHKGNGLLSITGGGCPHGGTFRSMANCASGPELINFYACLEQVDMFMS
eukprot:scaffold75754_cov17-Tisochrysis_lutea.AAC.2